MLKLIVASVIAFGLMYYWLTNNKNMKRYNKYLKRQKKFEESIQDFQSTKSFVNQNLAIAINDHNKKFCISIMKSGNIVTLLHDYKDIISCEVLENEVPLEIPSGSLPDAETVQDIPASESGESSGRIKLLSKKVYRIDLRIAFRDSENPFVLANFLFWEVRKDSEDYEQMMELAVNWYNIINNIIEESK